MGRLKTAVESVEQLGDAALHVFHKLTSDNLRNADKIGGLPMPSLGVGRLDVPVEGYGDITLIGSPDMVKPGARNPVFSADAYSPTYPSVLYKQDSAALDALNDQLAASRKIVGDRPFYPGSLEEGYRHLEDSNAVRAQFLQDRGVGFDIPEGASEYEITRSLMDKIEEVGREEYSAYARDLFDSLGSQEELFFGFTDLGNRRYKPHTLDNVVKSMKEDWRDQTGMYGSGALRAQVAPKFRKLSDIQDARGRIKPPEKLEAMKDELNERLINISDEFSKFSTYRDENPFITNDVTRERLTEISMGQASWDEYFPGAPDELKAEWSTYIEDLKNAPTGYFEGKPLRAVGLEEFQGALIPENAPAEVEDILRRRGIERIERYADEADRTEKLKSFRDLMFTGTGAAVGLGAAMAPEDAEAGPITVGGRRLIEAFHGTPHRFDKFSLDAIGTGEGAQAYGHGLYFADKRGTAENYRDQLSRYAIEFDGTPIDARRADPETIAQQFPGLDDRQSAALSRVVNGVYTDPRQGGLAAQRDAAESLRDMYAEGLADMSPSDPDYGAIKEMVQIAQDDIDLIDTMGDKIQDASGSLYRVNIEAQPEQMLQYDLPLAEQPESVQAAIDNLPQEIKNRIGLDSQEMHFVGPEGASHWSELIDQADLENPEMLRLVADTMRKNGQPGEWMTWGDMIRQKVTGGEFYHDLSRAITGNDRNSLEASKALREMGVPGIRYLEAGSRNNQPNIPDFEDWLGYNADFDADTSGAREAYADFVREKTDEFEANQAYNYVVFDDQLIDIKERGNASPEVLAATAAAATATDQFLAQRQEKAAFWDKRREELLSGLSAVSGAGMSALEALDIPMRGLYGLSTAAGGILTGQGVEESLLAGANVARQPLEETAYNMGGYITDKTGSPALGTLVNVAGQTASPF